MSDHDEGSGGRTSIRCPACGAKMRYREQDDEVRYLGRSRSCRTLAWWCSRCPEGVLDGVALRDREKDFRELKAKVDRELGPEGVAAARAKIRGQT